MAILQVGQRDLRSDVPIRVEAATALLGVHADGPKLAVQLEVYASLASRWANSSDRERADLGQALSDSRFAHRIQATLNAFTRAAWAGADAAPPGPQLQALAAFDAQSPSDRQIVAALRGGPLGSFPLTTAQAYRARLASEAQAAQDAEPASPAPPPVAITLSQEARDRLDAAAATPDPGPPPVQPRSPQIAAALEAYRKVAG